MARPQIVNPEQGSALDSPWSRGERVWRILWELCWALFCAWTPKPANRWRLFWLRSFGANIHGTPFVHQRARVAIPWNLTLHDGACLGDRANAYCLEQIEIRAHATVAQEAYLSTGSHDFSTEHIPLVTGKITVGEEAFVGARAFVMPGITVGARSVVGACSVVTKNIPSGVIAAGNPCRVLGPRTFSESR